MKLLSDASYYKNMEILVKGYFAFLQTSYKKIQWNSEPQKRHGILHFA